MNAIRTRTLLAKCDLAVVRFGHKYKQWNAAFDAGYCAVRGTPYIALHGEELIHRLIEVDGEDLAWAVTPEQLVDILNYVLTAD